MYHPECNEDLPLHPSYINNHTKILTSMWDVHDFPETQYVVELIARRAATNQKANITFTRVN